MPTSPARPTTARRAAVTTKAQARALARSVLANITKLAAAPTLKRARPTGGEDRIAKLAADPKTTALDLIKAVHRQGGTRLR